LHVDSPWRIILRGIGFLTMSQLVITVEQLRGMIGLEVRYRGLSFTVIEVLEDGPSLVLLDRAAGLDIQPSLLGVANRRVAQAETVPVLSDDRTELHAEFLAIELL
jgi:hypothetical protein